MEALEGRLEALLPVFCALSSIELVSRARL